MRRAVLLATVSLVAACGQAPGNSPSDNVVSTPSRDAPDVVPRPLAPAPPAPALEADSRPTPTPADTPDAEPGETQDTAAARALVIRYFAAIAARDYAAAWRMWDGAGEASGMSEVAFARSFQRYASYIASVGAPGRVDAGAGQRYVEVPVTVRGRLRDGGAFALEGPVTLHRTANIDGATPEQRRWSIRDSALKPRPDASTPAAVTARYRCADGTRFTAAFDNTTVTLTRGTTTLATLAQRRAASGIWYRGDGYDLRGKGRAATLTSADGAPVDCTADR